MYHIGLDGQPCEDVEPLTDLLGLLALGRVPVDEYRCAPQWRVSGGRPHRCRVYCCVAWRPSRCHVEARIPDMMAGSSLRLTIEVLDAHFPSRVTKNVGILNGAPSGNTVDVDLDADEARVARHDPATAHRLGLWPRSAPRSHWIYAIDMDLPTAKEAYEHLDSRDAPGVARHGRVDGLSAKHPQGNWGSDRLAHVHQAGRDTAGRIAAGGPRGGSRGVAG